MNHPFDFSTYSIRSQVYLSSQTGEYSTILAVDRMPTERTPFRDMVRMLRMPPLSRYQGGISNPCLRQGLYALTRCADVHLLGQSSDNIPYMGINDLPVLITLLSRWGYRVDTSMNSIISRINPRQTMMSGDGIVCYISIGDHGSLVTSTQN